MSEAKQHDEKGAREHSGGHGGGHRGGHGGEEHGEGAPEWIISFADNVTLLMGFFVIMLALNMGPKAGSNASASEGQTAGGASQPSAEYLDAVIGIRDAFNNPVDINSLDPNDQVLIQHLRQRRGDPRVEQKGPPGEKNKLESLRPTKYSNVCASVPFENNSAALTEAGRKAVDGVIEHVQGLRLVIEVRGHVSAAECFSAADHGMRLSFERALGVANLLGENGVDRRRLRVVACGDNDRLKPLVYDQEGHEANQRVEIVLTEELMADPARDASTAETAEDTEKPAE